MIKALAVLLLFQCLGETVSFAWNIPVPGPVIGMLLLLAALRLSKATQSTVEEPSLAFLKHLSLLFVPAGVGIVVYAGRVESDLVPIAATILVGTALTVCITAITAQALHRITSSHVAGSPQNVIQAATADGKQGEVS
ncbi:LrgA family protein [Burkholderia sp. 8Y]|uniref:CidA/LrgA family protein n=1 Tax=Burkholderia sp. 8Y TaxID=2653133 RepID=UPI0012F07E5E|nr:CidA/LrgA family protein [Burkholderia sp. 8Y]VXC18216.1 LrgA family protein [Burkholderia sp. 8Y]